MNIYNRFKRVKCDCFKRLAYLDSVIINDYEILFHVVFLSHVHGTWDLEAESLHGHYPAFQ